MTDWLALVLAGLFEIGFTTALKLEQKNRHFIWLFLACAALSFRLLEEALRSIPLGTAYAVWTGIGAVGTTVVGMVAFGEQASVLRLGLLGLAVLLIVGLKVIP